MSSREIESRNKPKLGKIISDKKIISKNILAPRSVMIHQDMVNPYFLPHSPGVKMDGSEIYVNLVPVKGEKTEYGTTLPTNIIYPLGYQINKSVGSEKYIHAPLIRLIASKQPSATPELYIPRWFTYHQIYTILSWGGLSTFTIQ